MAAGMTAGPSLSRDKGQVRLDFTFELTGPEYDRLELSWQDPTSTDAAPAPGEASVVNVEGKRTVIVPVYVPESRFTGDDVVSLVLRDADEAQADPLWQEEYRLLPGPDAEPA